METSQNTLPTSPYETTTTPYNQEPGLHLQSADENASGRIFSSFAGGTIESLGYIMTLAFLARVIADVVRRARAGRSLRRREAGGDVGDLTRRVWASLRAWENRLRLQKTPKQVHGR